MLDEICLEDLLEPALTFYKSNKRSLPWREDRNPYHIWVSEIMLQQTRVEAVKPYYVRWMEKLPDIDSLAHCEDETLLKLWEGLGYYNRARNMKKAAGIIMTDYSGQMPSTYDEIIALPGIGPYTAAAISSIAFEEANPAVDGNFLRIISRVADDNRDILSSAMKKDVTRHLAEAYRAFGREYGLLNQALMEIGATVCLPNGKPHCEECPWQNACLGLSRGTNLMLPIKKPKKERRIEEYTVLLIEDESRIFLQKRTEGGLLSGLFEYPHLDGFCETEDVISYVESLGLDPIFVQKLPDAKHLFSHIEWHMKGYLVRLASLTEDEVKSYRREVRQANEPFLVEIDEARERYSIPSAYSTYTNYSHGM